MQQFFQFNLRQDALGAAIEKLGCLACRAPVATMMAPPETSRLAALDQRHVEFADVAFDAGDFRFQVSLMLGCFSTCWMSAR